MQLNLNVHKLFVHKALNEQFIHLSNWQNNILFNVQTIILIKRVQIENTFLSEGHTIRFNIMSFNNIHNNL